jgi:hypothetical protein
MPARPSTLFVDVDLLGRGPDRIAGHEGPRGLATDRQVGATMEGAVATLGPRPYRVG